MTRDVAIEILKTMKPIPRRADGKSTTHILQTIALEMAIRTLEDKNVLDKIRAEIEQVAFKDVNGSKYIFVNRVNQIIDKYKESEDNA